MTTQKYITAEELEKVLIEKYGILIGGENLWKVLGFQSAGSFQRAATRKLIPLKIFPIDNRKGKFALAHDVANYLVQQREKYNESV
ncbi:MAG: hypothetical protein HWE16_02545 [Gammaproteobacteria bacterium]|nr:hypothetical protein [Gammaproteobacteria bacterium]